MNTINFVSALDLTAFSWQMHMILYQLADAYHVSLHWGRESSVVSFYRIYSDLYCFESFECLL